MPFQEFKQALEKTCEDAVSKGIEIGQCSFRCCPIGLFYEESKPNGYVAQISDLFGIGDGDVWAFICGFDAVNETMAKKLMTGKTVTSFNDYFELGKEFRKKYIQ